MERYADIVLPLAQPAYTYAVTDGLDVEEGQAVAVQFGARRIYTGIVWRIHGRRPDFPRIKTVSRVLYDRPLLDARQRALWEWMADYYLCTLGEVMRFALPQTIKPSGNSEQEFADREYRPRTELYAALDASLHDEERFHDLMERLSRRAPRQYAALLAIASAEGGDRISTGEVPRRLLEADAATLAALQKKGLVTLTRRERSVERGCVRFQLPTLTPAQQSCLDTIRGHFDAGRRTVLLHGITGSGKTELYIHLIAEALARGGDVLLLVPEIAITAQLIARLERIFGSRVTAYHSKLTLARRTESYLRLTRSDGGELVVGARSALFLPLRHLQLIVVDEEHDTGYKQTDAQPRYNARDVAVVMARLREARTVLGSGSIRDTLAGVALQMGVHEFYQVNTPAAEVLYAKAREYAALCPDDFLLDLYCGMGTIGLSMLPDCGRLLGVEVVPQAVEGAKETAARLGLTPDKADFRCQDAGQAAAALAAEGQRPDVIVVDPPRKGCDEATLTAIAAMAPRTVVMVSCNAATAARDTRWLADHGYAPQRVQPVDLFPRTKHVECVVLMSKVQ